MQFGNMWDDGDGQDSHGWEDENIGCIRVEWAFYVERETEAGWGGGDVGRGNGKEGGL